MGLGADRGGQREPGVVSKGAQDEGMQGIASSYKPQTPPPKFLLRCQPEGGDADGLIPFPGSCECGQEMSTGTGCAGCSPPVSPMPGHRAEP